MHSATETEAPAAESSAAELAIGGMTCASCAARIEKKLNRMDGVTATVNFATERARVVFGPETGVADLIATVQKTGYTAEPVHRTAPTPTSAPPAATRATETPDATTSPGIPDDPDIADAPDSPDGPTAALASLRQRLIVSAVLATPVVLLAMIPAFQFDNWQWLSLTLAAPVVVWGGLPFHRATWTSLRHGTATMDTLVSVGTIAAFGWSLWALFLGNAGMPGMRHGFDFTVSRTEGSSTIYLEVAAGVITFILLGRYL
ncbi:cation transporter, partial [Streptomyces brevispora]|uniref:cation transporter n=1 Tax=Streptomyces brevispora TaxID=887462 RepID=UPI0033CF4CC8